MTHRPTSNALGIIKKATGIDPHSDHEVQQYRREFAIGQLIYDARTAAGLTQQQLADLAGTNQTVVAQLESADYDGDSFAMLEPIANALGTHVEIRLIPNETPIQAG